MCICTSAQNTQCRFRSDLANCSQAVMQISGNVDALKTAQHIDLTTAIHSSIQNMCCGKTYNIKRLICKLVWWLCPGQNWKIPKIMECNKFLVNKCSRKYVKKNALWNFLSYIRRPDNKQGLWSRQGPQDSPLHFWHSGTGVKWGQPSLQNQVPLLAALSAAESHMSDDHHEKSQ